jgi:hypothetical protein
LHRKLRETLLPCLLLTLLAGPAAAISASDDPPLDVVVIQSQRARLVDLRKQLVQLERRFFDRYNELNELDDFDVNCVQEARTGTHLKGRSCRAVYQEKALQDEGQEITRYRQFIDDQVSKGPPGGSGAREPNVAGPPPLPANIAIEARRREYQRNMLEVARRDPQLAGILSERGKLLQRYDATRRQLFGLKPAADPP